MLSSCENDKINNQEICFDVNKEYKTKSGFIYVNSSDSLIPRLVSYIEVKNLKVYEGDILISTSENYGYLKIDTPLISIKSISTFGNLWPNGTIYYVIDPALTSTQKSDITTAINYWTNKTGLLFIKRNTEPNWVYFIPSQSGPSSDAVGMKGGKQIVNISPKTSLGNIIHEIGHVVGLWHEQSRKDRDSYIIINYNNIKPGKESQFASHDGFINTSYDYNSIMHYSKNAFALDPSKPTITAKNQAPYMGQRDSLSILDIKGIKKLYP